MRERRVGRDEVIARLQAARCAASSRAAQAPGEARGVLTTLGAALARVRRFAPLRASGVTRAARGGPPRPRLVDERFPDQPVTVRISDSSLPNAVGLIGNGKDLARSRTDCVSCSGVGVIHDFKVSSGLPLAERMY